MNRLTPSLVPNERSALLHAARDLYRERRLRDATFVAHRIFGEPAWDMLLDLYIASHAGEKISVTSVCVASSVPVTTALRWLGHLESQRLVLRSNDPNDRRRMLVSLTPDGIALMDSYLRQVLSGNAA